MAFALHSETMTTTPDRKELERLFELQALPLMPELYRFALMKMDYRPSDAEDLLQDTYLKAFRSFHQFEQGTDLKAWMRMIMLNTARNFWTKSNKDKAQRGLEEMEDWQIGDAESLTAMPSQSAEADAIRSMPAGAVKTALAQLPEEFREVVYYAIVADYTYAEIAKILDIPANTVGTRLFRGKKLLRKYLENYARQEGFLTDEPSTDAAAGGDR